MLLRIIFRNYRVIEIKVIDNKINKIYIKNLVFMTKNSSMLLKCY
jgi:hypothetical protein